MTFLIRDARLPDEEAQLLEFILGLQRFEQAYEPDRRVDTTVAREFYDVLVPRALAQHGRILVAERDKENLLGWCVVYEEENDVYVHEAERVFGYVSELFVAAAARGSGVGGALLDAAEEWARARALGVLMIGVLPGNARAAGIYSRAGFAPYSIRLRKYL